MASKRKWKDRAKRRKAQIRDLRTANRLTDAILERQVSELEALRAQVPDTVAQREEAITQLAKGMELPRAVISGPSLYESSKESIERRAAQIQSMFNRGQVILGVDPGDPDGAVVLGERDEDGCITIHDVCYSKEDLGRIGGEFLEKGSVIGHASTDPKSSTYIGRAPSVHVERGTSYIDYGDETLPLPEGYTSLDIDGVTDRDGRKWTWGEWREEVHGWPTAVSGVLPKRTPEQEKRRAYWTEGPGSKRPSLGQWPRPIYTPEKREPVTVEIGTITITPNGDPKETAESVAARIAAHLNGEPEPEPDLEPEPTNETPNPNTEASVDAFSGLIDIPEVTARRGGITFSGGWCAPAGQVYDLFSEGRPLTKKQKRRLKKQRAAAKKRRKAQKRKRDREIIAALKTLTEAFAPAGRNDDYDY